MDLMMKEINTRKANQITEFQTKKASVLFYIYLLVYKSTCAFP